MQFLEGEAAFGGGGGGLDGGKPDRNVLGDAAQDAFQVAVRAALLEDHVALHVEGGQFDGAASEAGEGFARREVGLLDHPGVDPALDHTLEGTGAGDDVREQRLPRDGDRRMGGGRRNGRRQGDIGVGEQQGDRQGDAAGHGKPHIVGRIADSALNRLTPDP